MLETATSDGTDEVQMTKSSEVLTKLLLYCSPGRAPPVDTRAPADEFWTFIKAFDKYGVSQKSASAPPTWV